MDLNILIDQIKRRPDYAKVGMILSHLGVVRATSREGRTVRGLRVSLDAHKLDEVIARHKEREGIVEILVQINAGRDLRVGEDVMGLVVAGDVRENVIMTMADLLDDIKGNVTKKTEYPA